MDLPAAVPAGLHARHLSSHALPASAGALEASEPIASYAVLTCGLFVLTVWIVNAPVIAAWRRSVSALSLAVRPWMIRTRNAQPNRQDAKDSR